MLHDRTRRKLAIGIFLTCCLAPTVWVSAWCARRHLPVVVEAETREFARQLGLAVTVEDIDFVRPGITDYRQVVVVHPETARPLLRCGMLRIERGRSADTGRPYLLLKPDALEVASDDADEIVTLLLWVLQGHGGWDGSDVYFQSARVRFPGQPADVSPWTDVSGKLETVAEGVRWQMTTRLPGDTSGKLPWIALARNRQSSPARTEFSVQTGAVGIPVQLAALLVPKLDLLGSQARFVGQFSAREGPEGWDGEGSGRFEQVDLERLTTGTLGEPLTGLGTVQCDVVRIRGGRIAEFTASAVSRQGVVSRGFADLAQREGGLLPGITPPGNLTEWPYEELALGWTVTAEGFTVRGGCSVPGAILVDRYGPLLLAPADQPQPLATLVGLLCPQSSANTVQMPATPQAATLLQYLP